MYRFVAVSLLGLALVVGRSAAAADQSFPCAVGAKAERVESLRVTLGGVPAVVRLPKSVERAPIVLWHGFGPPASANDLMKALPLDDVPAVKIYLGLPLFGARAPVKESESVARRQSEDYALKLFEPAVLGAAKELPAVVKALVEKKCVAPDGAIGLFGFSAGGAAALIALAEREVPVRAAVTVNAPTSLDASIDALERATKRAYVWTPAARELAQRADSVRRAGDIAKGKLPPALLIFHGADDKVITVHGAEALHAALQPYYSRSGDGDRLKLTLAPSVSHNWTDPRTLAELRTEVAAWFNRYL